MNFVRRFAVALVGSALLTGCGGGGGAALLSPGDPTTFSAPPPAQWVTDVGGAGHAYGIATTVLQGGDVLLVGAHDADLVLGRGSPTETTIPGGGDSSLFAACYGSDGALRWTRSARATEYVVPYASTATPDGGFVLCGFFAGVVSFAGGPGSAVQASSIGSEGAFLARYTAGGALLWVRSFGAPDGFAEALALTTLADGGIAVTGLYAGQLTVGAGEPAQTSMTSSEMDAFVARFRADGTVVWARSTATSIGYTTAWALTSTADLGVVVGGEVHGTSTFGLGEPAETTLDSVLGSDDTWVARFAPADGALEWVRRIGGAGEDQVYGLTVCADGSYRVAGYFRDTAEVDADGPSPLPLVSAGALDVYVAAFDPAGHPLWARSYGGPGDDYATAASGLRDGSLVLTGVCHGPVDFGGAGPMASPTPPLDGETRGDIFVVRLDCLGNAVWIRVAGGTQDDYGSAVVVDEKTNATYVTGSFTDTAHFFIADPSFDATSSGVTDAFLARLPADGGV